MIFKSISCRTIFLLIILTHLSSCDIEDITPSAGEGKITLHLDLVEINIAEAKGQMRFIAGWVYG